MSARAEEAMLWALHEGPWVPLNGLLARAAAESGLPSKVIALSVMRLVETGDIPIRIKNEGGRFGHSMIWNRHVASIYFRNGLFDRISWHEGRLSDTGDLIEVYWPDVIPSLLNQADDPPHSDHANGRPSQLKVNAWMLNFYMDRLAFNGSPPKRENEAWPACKQAINASDEQMRQAVRDIPDTLKKRRGRPKIGRAKSDTV